jgi:hypothetical protein
MTSTTMRPARNSYLDRPSPGGLAEVVDLILDKGLVIDIFVRVSVVGIELLTIDARIVIASVDTYLRFAEAVNRLDLAEKGPKGLPDLMGSMAEGGARSKTRGVLEGVTEKAHEVTGSHPDDGPGDDGPEDGEAQSRPRPRRRREERA